MKNPSINDMTCLVDIIDECIKEHASGQPPTEGMDVSLTETEGNEAGPHQEELDANPVHQNECLTLLPAQTQEQPKVEMKELPKNLRYEFLGSNRPVIVSADLGETETEKTAYCSKKVPESNRVLNR
jgi:hypothetical protein